MLHPKSESSLNTPIKQNLLCIDSPSDFDSSEIDYVSKQCQFSEESFSRCVSNIPPALDGEAIFFKDKNTVVCRYCSLFSTVRGNRGNYAHGAHPRRPSHLQKHLQSPVHVECEKKWNEQFKVCSRSCLFFIYIM
jgi:hypothetical protein